MSEPTKEYYETAGQAVFAAEIERLTDAPESDHQAKMLLAALDEVRDRVMEKFNLSGSPFLPRDLTIRELQTQLPWTVHYHHDFRSSPMTHKDFGHALLHVTKATGKLAAVVNDAEHGGSEFKPEEVDRFVADLVVCALRMANTCPGRTIDLQRAVEDRIETKNEAELRREAQ